MLRSLKEHWPEYFCEAAELGLFMVSASLFTMLLWHPSSPVLNLIPDPFVRRMLTGIAMGGTAIALVFSPLGKRSGAHFNPAVTLTFWRLGKVKNWDALFYVVAQFIGAIAGVLAVTLFVREALAHPRVNYAATLPGMQGVIVALHCRICDCVCVDVGGAPGQQHTSHRALHWIICRRTGRHLHHAGIAAFGHEHEPGAHIRLRGCRTYWGGALDLLHGAGAGDAICSGCLSPRQGRSLLREISSLQSAPLHF